MHTRKKSVLAAVKYNLNHTVSNSAIILKYENNEEDFFVTSKPNFDCFSFRLFLY